MSNVSAPFGFRWIGDISSGQQNGMVNEYIIPSTDSANYFVGDPVKSTGTGAQDPVSQMYFPTVTLGTAGVGTNSRGVIVGFRIDPTNLNVTYGVGSTTRIALVADQPYAKFIIQSNGTAAITDFGGNANFASGSGSTITGLSGFVLDESSFATTDAQLRILWPYPTTNNTLGLYTQYVVMFNDHEFKTTSGN